MRLSMIAAMSQNGVIGSGKDIPWAVKGEQLLFKALTFGQWCIVGRKTFEAMGQLPDRKFVVVSRAKVVSHDPNVIYVRSIEAALSFCHVVTNHAYVIGGGELYQELIDKVDVLHLTTVHKWVEGNVYFPALPDHMVEVFAQGFTSNIDFVYRMYLKGDDHENME
ncbi:dihydrofolate reductase [Vibrio parahaemolyticus]